MSKPILAWHFCSRRDDGEIVTNEGGLVVRIGETLRHDGPLVLCSSGLHASVRAIDALQYARGLIACRVRVGGEVVRGDDKLVAAERSVLWAVDARSTLRRFARLCALDGMHLWSDPPAVVARYLRTGDESIRAAAKAAWDAARAAARDAQDRRLARMLSRAPRIGAAEGCAS